MAVSINPAVSFRRVRIIIDDVEYSGDCIEFTTQSMPNKFSFWIDLVNVNMLKAVKTVPVVEMTSPSRRIVEEVA